MTDQTSGDANLNPEQTTGQVSAEQRLPDTVDELNAFITRHPVIQQLVALAQRIGGPHGTIDTGGDANPAEPKPDAG